MQAFDAHPVLSRAKVCRGQKNEAPPLWAPVVLKEANPSSQALPDKRGKAGVPASPSALSRRALSARE